MLTVLRPFVSFGLEATKRLPAPLQDIALSAYGAYFHHFRYGGAFRAAREELARGESRTAEEIERFQREQLAALLRHCAARVPHYRALFARLRISERDFASADILSRLPILEKRQVQDEPRAFVAEGVPPWKRVSKGTAGTTGSPMVFVSTQREIQRYWAFADRCRTWAGSRLGARRATFSGIPLLRGDQTEPPFWRHDRIENKVLLSIYHLSPTTVRHYARFLNEFKPEEILGHPSALSLLAAIWPADVPVAFPPPALVTTGEQLFPAQKAGIEERFGGRVSDQYSAGGEMGPVISTCERGTYHEHPESGVIELVTPEETPAADGERGEIVITGFTNWTMPLVRYRTGDASRRVTAACACGRAFRSYAVIEGKIADRLVLPDGRMIGNVYSLVESFPGVRECQILQHAVDRVTIVLVPGPDWSDRARAAVERQARDFLGDRMQVSLRLVETIERTKRGKLRLVVSELQQSPLVAPDEG